MKNRKEYIQLAKQAEKQGWIVTKTNGGHLKWRSPNGVALFSAYSSGDTRSVKNFRSQLRMAGFIEFQGRRNGSSRNGSN